VLVTDAQLRSSLVAIRSFGKKNIKISAGSELVNAMGHYSKYCTRKIIYPNPRTETSKFLTFMLDMVKKNGYDCIIPFHTYTAFLLSKYKDIFKDYTHIPPPDFKVYYNAFNKIQLLKTAQKNNITIPKTYFSQDIEEIIDSIDNYPVIVKPSKRHGIKISICDSQIDLKINYNDMTKKYGQCIVQEFIPNGGEVGVYTIFDKNSDPIALTVQERLRCMNSYGGISTLRKTIKNDELVNIAFNLLKIINWSGAAMVEFRIDSRDNKPKLMEINPRFWGSLQLSISSGIDFPYILYQLTMDEKPQLNLDFKENVYCRWFIGEITNFFNYSGKIKRLVDLMRPKVINDVISINDPKPGLVSLFSPVVNSSDEEPRNDDKNSYIEVLK
jgi:predicted ATP-grasp superfamily ATP-dependent carboligase